MTNYGEVREKKVINSAHEQYNRTAHRTGAGTFGRVVAGERTRAGHTVIVKKKVKADTPFPIGFVFYALIISVLLMFIAYSYSVVNDISYEIDQLEDSISVNKQENERLTIALDNKNDLTYIENEAANRLGMVKSTEVTRRYVNISGGDKVVITEENQTSDSFGTTLDGLKNTVGKIYQ